MPQFAATGRILFVTAVGKPTAGEKHVSSARECIQGFPTGEGNSMRDRNTFWAITIAILTLLALWANLPMQHPQWVNDLLFWQPQESKNYNRNTDSDPLRIRQGLDLQGGVQVVLQAVPVETQAESALEAEAQLAASIETARNIIERRVNGLGVSEALVQTQGDDRVVVELPGIEDPELAISTIKETGLLEFIDTGATPLPPGLPVRTTLREELLAATPGLTGTTTLTGTGEVTPTTPLFPEQDTLYETVFTGRDLKQAFPARNPTTGEYYVAFELQPDASTRFAQYTENNIGQFLTIVLDGVVVSSPRIQSVIPDGSGQITGDFSFQEARSLGIQLQYGALPVPLRVESQRSVGATLGEESVQKSVTAGIIGLITVLLFMIIYYRLPGSLASLALLIYALLNLSVFRLLPVTLTLPGITGFLLSTGMAVDANILIFERMKEELRRGRTLHAAIEAGFDRAWTSIRDSNISTLIICAILYWLGSGFSVLGLRLIGAPAVKGFAITLAIGVLISMFTAVIVTRTFLRLLFKLAGEGLREHPRLLGV
jgi:protein-export membrane protein SecD